MSCALMLFALLFAEQEADLEPGDKVMVGEVDGQLIEHVRASDREVIWHVAIVKGVHNGALKVRWRPFKDGYRTEVVARNAVLTADEAIAHFTKKLQRKRAAHLYSGRALALWQKKEFLKALADCEGAIELNPQSVRLYLLRGIIFKSLNNIEGALGEIDRAIELKPADARLHQGRALILAEMRNVDGATSAFNEAIRLNPSDSSIRNDYGLLWVMVDNPDRAIREFDAAIALTPNDPAAVSNRGIAWAMKGEVKKGLADLQRAIRMEPTDAQAHLNYARVLSSHPDERFRDGRQAVAVATRACELTGWQDTMHLTVLAMAYAEANDFENAVKWQRKALELMPAKLQPVGKDILRTFEYGIPYRDTSF